VRERRVADKSVKSYALPVRGAAAAPPESRSIRAGKPARASK
jgi:hypothetical protein